MHKIQNKRAPVETLILKTVYRQFWLVVMAVLMVPTNSFAQTGTAITGPCPVIITVPGDYYLAADLGPCGGDGIWIQASNVALNLNGHTISRLFQGNDNAGIRVEVPGLMTTLMDVSIEGPGVIQNFSRGVMTRNSADSQIEGVTVTGNDFGIVVGSGAPPGAIHSNWRISGNTLTLNAGYGIILTNSTHCLVDRNDISSSFYEGIVLDQNSQFGTGISSDNTIFKNNTTTNYEGGIEVRLGSVNNHIKANRAEGNVAEFDLQDHNPNCDSNKWRGNKFGTANQSCIK